MSRRGNCWDNAVVESFFATLKTELVHQADYLDREEARRATFEYIEVFYNRQRRHSTLGYQTPAKFEELTVAASVHRPPNLGHSILPECRSLDVAIAEGEAIVQSDAVAGDGSWEAVAAVQIFHALQSAIPKLP